MPWCINALHRPITALNDFAVSDQVIWIKVHIATLFNLHTLLNFACAVRPISVSGCACFGLQQPTAWRVIHVRMRDKDMRHRLAWNAGQNGVYVGLIVWARIYDGNAPCTQDIGTGAVKSERAWVVRDDPSYPWC